ncbi:MAG: hypothetical protein AUI49_08065 [Candidatus Rokubacteria bacterium 13_1_40CM_2_68_13]|nr:MAG: hypothetical protein AUI49_08065 [Candidatus Rokubacteria bacterium 13_1_40CM_2_68_13]
MIGQQQRARPGLAEDVGELVTAVARIQGDDHGAEPRAGELGDEPRRPVGQPDAHLVAAADPDGGQPSRQPTRAVAELAERHALVGEDDRLAGGMSHRDRVDEVRGGGGLEWIAADHSPLT